MTPPTARPVTRNYTRGLTVDRFDVLALLGLICFAAGCGLVYMPLGLIVWGLGLIGLAFMGARNASVASVTDSPKDAE